MAIFNSYNVPKSLNYLAGSISNLSKFLAYEASEDVSIEKVKLCTKPDTRYGVETLRLEFIAYNADGAKLDIFISGLDKKVRNKDGVLVPAMYYGYYTKSKDAVDFVTYGIKGDSLYLLPLLDKVLHWIGEYQEDRLDKKPISSVEWHVYPAIRNDFREFRSEDDNVGEVALIFHRSWGEQDAF